MVSNPRGRIQYGNVAGFDQGEFFVDTEGNLTPVE